MAATSELSQAKEKKKPTGAAAEYEFSGSTYGARLGWSWQNKYIVAVDVGQTEADWELENSSLVDEMKGTHYGLFAANRFPFDDKKRFLQNHSRIP